MKQKNYVQKGVNYLKSGTKKLSIAVSVFFSHLSFSQLPTVVNPPGSASTGGDFLAYMQGWSGAAVDYIALVISSAGFLWVGWILLSKFNEARSSNDPDWGSVGLTAVIAGVLLVVVTYFLTQATNVI